MDQAVGVRQKEKGGVSVKQLRADFVGWGEFNGQRERFEPTRARRLDYGLYGSWTMKFSQYWPEFIANSFGIHRK